MFESINELVDFIKNTPRRSDAEDASETGSYDFTGTNSFNEAVELLRYGDENLLKKINEKKSKINISKILGNKVNRNALKSDVVGFIPDVPAYLKGVPYNMINSHRIKLSQKIVNIVVNVSLPWHISKDEIIDGGALYTTVIDLLEKQGYRCNIYAGKYSERNGKCFYGIVKIKTDREPLNLKKIVFCLANPSFLRRIMFKWSECCDSNSVGVTLGKSGYGHVIEDEKKLKKVFNDNLRDNTLIWTMTDDYELDVENMISKLEEQGIKIKN